MGTPSSPKGLVQKMDRHNAGSIPAITTKT